MAMQITDQKVGRAVQGDEKMDLIERLRNATQDDYVEVAGRIDEITSELSLLRSLEKILRDKFANRPIASKDGLIDQIYDFIANNGPMKAAEIGEAFGISSQGVGCRLSNRDWFVRHDDGKWGIARMCSEKT